jgi:hypothetical protein
MADLYTDQDWIASRTGAVAYEIRSSSRVFSNAGCLQI